MMMNNEIKTLRDELAMNAPDDLINDPQAFMTEECPKNCEGADYFRWKAEATIRARFAWADIFLRIRAETMPKVERKHPEWARWAARDEDGQCFYYSRKPALTDDGYWQCEGGGKELVDQDTSWLPSDWRNSLKKLNG